MPPADGQVPIFLSATDDDLPEPLPQGLAKYSNFRDLARGGSAMLRTCFERITGRTIVIKTLLPEVHQDEKEITACCGRHGSPPNSSTPTPCRSTRSAGTWPRALYFTMKRVWGELVQAHDDRGVFQASPDELPAIDIHSL